MRVTRITKRTCADCGAEFEGKGSAHLCEVCKKIRTAENSRKASQRHYKSVFDFGPLPKIEDKPLFLGDEQRYCSAYDGENLECIKCYENQIKEYKGCYTKSRKSS